MLSKSQTTQIKLSLMTTGCFSYMVVWAVLVVLQYPHVAWLVVHNEYLSMSFSMPEHRHLWWAVFNTIILVVPGFYPVFLMLASYFFAGVGQLLSRKI